MMDRYIKPGQIDLILHLGDQIYGDSAFGKAMSILNGKSKGNKRQETQILELYRSLYRMTWNYPPTQGVLASTSNLMIWDDHEIRDGWGSQKCDYDKSSPEFYVGTLARKVFREYQRQLWDDIDVDEVPGSGYEHHFHTWGSIGVMFVDQRGGRSFERDAEKPYLGTKQWNDISNALSTGGLFSDVRALLVVTSVPLVYLSSGITTKGSMIDMVEDLKDHWAYLPHRKEQIEMIRLLRRWKEASDDRNVLVIGGDVHVGGHTSIEHYDKEIFKQFITSPVTNKPPNWYQFYGIRLLMEAKETLGSSYSFEHYDFIRRRNFGFILVRVPPDSGKPKLEGTLVEATPI